MTKIHTPILLRLCAALAAGGLSAVGLSGCHQFHQQAAVPHRPKVVRLAQAPILPVDLTKVQPNEVGKVPILEYHDMVTGNKYKDYQYPVAEFRKDLDWLYAHDYRPISLSDYAKGIVDCPAGTSPVILTFDDATRGQFRYRDDGKIDPDCAVGVLEAFHIKHPDWPLKGTFFVLDASSPKLPPAFFQSRYEQAKLKYLVQDGFEIGNHTVHHWQGMRHWSDAKVQAELAGGAAGIQKLLPGYAVQTLALPYGIYPHNHKLVVTGQSGGVRYHNICALRAGWDPAPSPMSKEFKPFDLPRIIPSNAKVRPGGLNTIRYWLKMMEKDKSEKFVSDGDPNTYTVNALDKSVLNVARLQKLHFHLRTYSGKQLTASK